MVEYLAWGLLKAPAEEDAMTRSHYVLRLTMIVLLSGLGAGTTLAKADAGWVFLANTMTDGVDIKIGDGCCEAANGKCTLRAAIQEARANIKAADYAGEYYGIPLPPQPTTCKNLPDLSRYHKLFTNYVLIKLPIGTFTLDPSLGPLMLRSHIILSGSGAHNTRIEGDGTFPLIIVDEGPKEMKTVSWKNEINFAAIKHLHLSKGQGDEEGGATLGGALTTQAATQVNGVTFANNQGMPNGGAIYNTAPLEVLNSIFEENSGSHGTAIYSTYPITIHHSRFHKNNLLAGHVITLQHGQLQPPYLYASTITETVITENTGYGLYVGSNTFCTITDSQISHNKNFGIYSEGIDPSFLWTAGTIHISRSTISHTDGAGVSLGGGGVLRNSTISSNSEVGLIVGGCDTCRNKVQHTTIANNGIIGINLSGNVTVKIQNSIIWGHSVAGMVSDIMGCGTKAHVVSEGYNIYTPGFGCQVEGKTATDLNQDPELLPLAHNGGYSKTHSLAPGSPAIDAATEPLMVLWSGQPLTEDQRKALRPIAIKSPTPIADIGAVEVTPTEGLPTLPSPKTKG